MESTSCLDYFNRFGSLKALPPLLLLGRDVVEIAQVIPIKMMTVIALILSFIIVVAVAAVAVGAAVAAVVVVVIIIIIVVTQ